MTIKQWIKEQNRSSSETESRNWQLSGKNETFRNHQNCQEVLPSSLASLNKTFRPDRMGRIDYESNDSGFTDICETSKDKNGYSLFPVLTEYAEQNQKSKEHPY